MENMYADETTTHVVLALKNNVETEQELICK